MSVQRAQFEITSTEFLDWIIYLNEEELVITKLDYQLAKLQAELRRSWVSKPISVREDNFLVKITRKILKKKKKLTVEEADERSMKYMAAKLGIPIPKEMRK